MRELIEVRLLKSTSYWSRFQRLLLMFVAADTTALIVSLSLLSHIVTVVTSDATAQETYFFLLAFLIVLVFRTLLRYRSEQFISLSCTLMVKEIRDSNLDHFLGYEPHQLSPEIGKEFIHDQLTGAQNIRTYVSGFLSRIPSLVSLSFIALPLIALFLGFGAPIQFTVTFSTLILIEMGISIYRITVAASTTRDARLLLKKNRGLQSMQAQQSDQVETEDLHNGLSALGRIKELRWTDCAIEYAPDGVAGFPWGIASAGKLTTIVGQASVAKSKLIETLLGMHQPSQGRLFVETTKGTFRLDDLDPTYWRDQIAWISSDPLLLSGTLEENLRLVKPRTNRQRLTEIIQEVGLDESVAAEGLATMIGQSQPHIANYLSRAVALARVMLKDPMIILVEEAKSDSDSEFERLLLQKLKDFARNGKLVITINGSETARELADRVIKIDAEFIQPEFVLEKA